MKVEVCMGQNCKSYGAEALLEELENCGIAYEVTACRSLCQYAPVMFVHQRARLKVGVADVAKMRE